MKIESTDYVDFKVKFNTAVADPWDEAKRNNARLAFEQFRKGFKGRFIEALHAESWDYQAIRNFLDNGQFLVPGNAEAEQRVLKMAILRAFVQVFGQREIRLKAQVARDNLKEICEQSQAAADAIGQALG
jgi:hypothetical protein